MVGGGGSYIRIALQVHLTAILLPSPKGVFTTHDCSDTIPYLTFWRRNFFILF